MKLANHPLFEGDTELGKVCSLSKLKVSKSCLKGQDEVSQQLTKAFDKLSTEVLTRWEGKFYKPSLISKDFREQNSCGIPEKEILKANYAKSRSDAILLSELFQEYKIKSDSYLDAVNQLKMKVKESWNDDNQAKVEELSKNINIISSNIEFDPVMQSIFQDEDSYKEIKKTNFSIGKILEKIEDKDINSIVRQELKDQCDNTFKQLEKALCGSHQNYFPQDSGDLSAIMRKRIEVNDVSSFALASQEIELYCRSNAPFDLNDINQDLLAKTPNQYKLAENAEQAAIKELELSFASKNSLLCKEVAKLKLAELPKKIQEQGCNDKKLDQDCIYLKTVEALYKDEIRANPNITFTELFNTQQEKPKLIRAFLGEDLPQKNELADKKEVDNDVKQTGQQVNSSGSMAQNNFSNNAQAERSPASTSENNYSVATQENTNQQNVVNQNMRDLYNEVASRIQSGKAAEKKEQKRKLNLNPFKKKDYQVSDTVSQAISGSINDFPYNENFFGAEEVAMDDEYTPEANFFDPGPPNEDPEESAEQVLNKKYNRALAGMIPKEQAPKDVTHYEGKKLTKQLQIGSSAHDSEHITIKVNDVDKLEDMLAAISEGNFPNKDKLLEFLEKDEEGVFYIEAIKGQNFVVKLVKDEDGNLRIDRPSYAPKKNKKYENFYASVEKLVKSSLDNASKWIDLLKGIIKDNTYKRFLKDN